MADEAIGIPILGWYFLGKPAEFKPELLRGIFLPKEYMKGIRRFCLSDLAADRDNRMYVGSVFLSTPVVAVFDLKKGSLIPFFVEREKAIQLQLI